MRASTVPLPIPYSSYRAAPAHATAIALAALLSTTALADESQGTANAPPQETSEESDPAATTKAPRTVQESVRPTEPPPDPSLEEARGPDVTLIAGEERTVYEYRQNGKLRMIKVVPNVGKPYFLVPRDPTTGFGDLEQADTLVPRWVLFEF